MSDQEIANSEAYRASSRPPIVEGFGIIGLYGYRNISLVSEQAATVLIARNGTGKTTLLGALDAVLKQQFSRLRDIEFEQIWLKIHGESSALFMSRSDLDAMLEVPTDSDLLRLSRNTDLSASAIFRFLTEDWTNKDNVQRYGENEIFSAIYRHLDYNHRKAVDQCDALAWALSRRTDVSAAWYGVLTRVLAGYEVVYLPTYRRVELALSGDSTPDKYGRKRKAPINLPDRGLFSGDIQFGLSDISDRLAEMNSMIVSESNNGYRQLSANVINQLIDGTIERGDSAHLEIPSREELQLFLSRLEQGRRAGPFYPISIPNIDKIYSGDELPAESGKYLTYFLNQLGVVIGSTQDVENRVREFIIRCNAYLSSSLSGIDDFSVNGGDAAASDGKQLRLNRENLRVHVESIPEGRKIPLDALSSGEKQMVSLFAKLFLYEKRKIVLIDEPELSLSIDWQRNILVDVITAPLCDQVIAITHSPFVFDNELEHYARPLQVSRQETMVFSDREILDF